EVLVGLAIAVLVDPVAARVGGAVSGHGAGVAAPQRCPALDGAARAELVAVGRAQAHPLAHRQGLFGTLVAIDGIELVRDAVAVAIVARRLDRVWDPVAIRVAL